MIVLDTNVLSELMRASPEPKLLAWLTRQPIAGLFTTTLTQAEIFEGLALLPEGRRRIGLTEAARTMFEVEMAGPVLRRRSRLGRPGDRRRTAQGRPADQPDRGDRAVARSAPRDARDFTGCGITVIDPRASP